MAIGLLNYVAAGAGEAMGHAADAAYTHWTDRDLQDQKDQAEAKKEKRVAEAKIAERNEQAAYDRSDLHRSDQRTQTVDTAVNNQVGADAATSQGLINKGKRIALENRLKVAGARGDAEAAIEIQRLQNEFSQSPETIKSKTDADLYAKEEGFKNDAKLEPFRLMSPEQIKADAATALAARKTQAEINEKEAIANKNKNEGFKFSAEAINKGMEADTRIVEAHVKALGELQKSIDGATGDDAKLEANKMYQKEWNAYQDSLSFAAMHVDQLYGIKREPINAGAMPPPDTETSVAPGGGSVPTVPAATVPAATVPAAAKPTGAINTTEKPSVVSPFVNPKDSTGAYTPATKGQQALMTEILNTKWLSPGQKAYLKENPDYNSFVSKDPRQARRIMNQMYDNKNMGKQSESKQKSVAEEIINSNPAPTTDKFQEAKETFFKLKHDRRVKDEFNSLSIQDQKKKLRDLKLYD